MIYALATRAFGGVDALEAAITDALTPKAPTGRPQVLDLVAARRMANDAASYDREMGG